MASSGHQQQAPQPPNGPNAGGTTTTPAAPSISMNRTGSSVASPSASAATSPKKKKGLSTSGQGESDTKKKKVRTKNTAAAATTSAPTIKNFMTTTNTNLQISNTLAKAARAKADLSALHHERQTIRNDVVWLKNDDEIGRALTSYYSNNKEGRMTGAAHESLEKFAGPSGLFARDEVAIVENALLKNGLQLRHKGALVGDVTLEAFGCLLEQARRYALELLADSQDYANHADRPEVTTADLLLAADSRADSLATKIFLPLNLELLDHAEEINRIPLPPIPSNCYHGIVLPEEQHQLTARTFDVVSTARVAQRMSGHVPPPVGLFTASPGESEDPLNDKGPATAASYGAHRGRQISVHLKSNQQQVPAESNKPGVEGDSGEGVASMTGMTSTSNNNT